MSDAFEQIDFHNNQGPYISDTNLNLMQTRINGALNTTNTEISKMQQYKKNDAVDTQGWYRVAIIHGGMPARSMILSISTRYYNNAPNSILFAITTTYHKIKIKQITCITSNDDSYVLTKMRAFWDSTNECFYVDVYYNKNSINPIDVKNITLMDSDFNNNIEIINPTLETFSGTALSEITINYGEIQPFYSYLNSYFINSWDANGQCIIEMDQMGFKHITVSCRNGTSTNVFQLPNELKPANTILLPATNGTSIGYATIYTSGIISVSSNIYTSGSSNFIFSGIYK